MMHFGPCKITYFPPSHADLLSVRGTYNKRNERTESYEAREGSSDSDGEDDGHGSNNSDE